LHLLLLWWLLLYEDLIAVHGEDCARGELIGDVAVAVLRGRGGAETERGYYGCRALWRLSLLLLNELLLLLLLNLLMLLKLLVGNGAERGEGDASDAVGRGDEGERNACCASRLYKCGYSDVSQV
jgi:hypothetical protein